MNSWQLSFLPKSRQPTSQHGAEETYKPPPLNEKPLMADVFLWEGEHFLSVVSPGRSNTLLWTASNTQVYGQHKLNFLVEEFFKRMQSQEG